MGGCAGPLGSRAVLVLGTSACTEEASNFHFSSRESFSRLYVFVMNLLQLSNGYNC